MCKSARKSLNWYQKFTYQPPSTKQCNKRKIKYPAAGWPLKWLQTFEDTNARCKIYIKLCVCSRKKQSCKCIPAWQMARRFKSVCAQQTGTRQDCTHPSTAQITPLSSKPSWSLSLPAMSGWNRKIRISLSALLCSFSANHSSSHRGDRASLEVDNEMGERKHINRDRVGVVSQLRAWWLKLCLLMMMIDSKCPHLFNTPRPIFSTSRAAEFFDFA